MFPRDKANEILSKSAENDAAVDNGWEGLGNIQFPRDDDPEAVPSEQSYDVTPTPNDEEKNPDAILRNAGPDTDQQPVGELTDMPAEETNDNAERGTGSVTGDNEPSLGENESAANTDEYDDYVTSHQSTNTGEVA